MGAGTFQATVVATHGAKYNELLTKSRKHQTKLSETLRHDNSELLKVKKDSDKRLEQLCVEKRSVTSNNKDLYQI